MNKIYLKELYLTYPIKDLFHQLTRDLVIKVDNDKFPNYIFYFNDNNCIFEYNKESGNFYCNYKLYWTNFYEKFDFNWQQVRDITKDMVENHFKLKGITPQQWYCLWSNMVENHFKLKGITPLWLKSNRYFWVENHFKLKN